jgi:hypothetical protein
MLVTCERMATSRVRIGWSVWAPKIETDPNTGSGENSRPKPNPRITKTRLDTRNPLRMATLKSNQDFYKHMHVYIHIHMYK